MPHGPYQHATGTCARCGKHGELVGRRLHKNCYQAARRRGQLDQYPRRLRTTGDLIDEIVHLVNLGFTATEIRAQLGYANPRSLRARLEVIRKRTP